MALALRGLGVRNRIYRLVDRYPFNSPWVEGKVRTGARWFLPLYFAALTVSNVAYYVVKAPASFGFDVRLYSLAADAWLAGQDPWQPTMDFDATVRHVSYAGPPPTLLPFILLSWVPVNVVVLLFALGSTTAAVWTLRHLGLPGWWILFPPIIEGIWVGNLNIFVIALLVAGSTFTGAIATILKVYAAVPLLIQGRWRPLVLAGLLGAISAPLVPWAQFIGAYPAIASSLTQQAWGGDSTLFSGPLVTVGAAIALVLLGRERAAWLAVPVIWPATQLHYTVLALPAMTPALAVFAAINQPGYLAFGVILFALWTRRDLLFGGDPDLDSGPQGQLAVAVIEEPP